MSAARFTLGWLPAVVATAVLVAGCAGGGDITAPGEALETTSATLAPDDDTRIPASDVVVMDPKAHYEEADAHPAASLRGRKEEPTSMSKVISAMSGGVLGFGRITLQFQAGALTEDTVVTIVREKEANGAVYFQILPLGLDLLIPATLTVDMGEIVANPRDTARMCSWVDESQTWVDIGGSWTYPRMTSSLSHFSRHRCIISMSAEAPAESLE